MSKRNSVYALRSRYGSQELFKKIQKSKEPGIPDWAFQYQYHAELYRQDHELKSHDLVKLYIDEEYNILLEEKL